ncbi:MAG TPA: serine O-acetyltransferase [Clostridiales bacterium UBA8960]|jgi:serine O-acetyltransferase|nr:serine O-acetyltransferase [Clostridiales bacterium UBA8960]
MIKHAMSYLKFVKENDPAARTYLEILLLYPSVHAIALYRVSNFLFRHHLFFLARFTSQFARLITGIEIHPGATIGKSLFIDHGMGVVIGETAIVGDYVTIYQGVTLGGTGKDTGKRHPTVGDRVTIGAGAKILGPIHIAAGTKIGAGSVVLTDTKTESTAVGVPARVIGGIESSVIPIHHYKGKSDVYNDMVI